VSRSRLAVAVALLAAVPALALAQDVKAPAAPADKPAAPAAKAPPAAAAKAAPAAKPAPAPPAKAAAVKPAAAELARLLMPKKTWGEGLEQLGQMVQGRMTAHPGGQPLVYPKDFQSKVKAELEAVLPYEELIGLHAKELGAAFSDGELGDMLGFYRSTTGQKALVKMGEVQNTVGLETQKRIEGKMPEIMKKLSALAKVPPQKDGKGADGMGKGVAPGAKPSGHP
jgi:uncharacterized protein